MKLILSKDGVKREIETPFALCISPVDMQHLAQELIAQAAGMQANGGSYGWVLIDTGHPDKSPPNTPPRKWTE